MFRSIRTRLAVSGMFLVLLTAGCLMWFAHKDTITALRVGERRGLNNVLYLLERELAAAHADALQAKIAAVESIKLSLHEASAAAGRMIAATADAPEAQAAPALVRWAENTVSPSLVIRFFRDGEGGPRDIANGEPLPERLARVASLLPRGDGERILDGETLIRIERHERFLVVCSRSLESAAETARANLTVVGDRFKDLLRSVHIQQTGFAAVLDASGRMVSGPDHAVIPKKLRETLAAGTFSGASRRVMVLPPDEGGGTSDVLYLLGYFRPLQWNIVLAAPLDELEAPAYTLVDRQLRITLAVLLGGLVLGGLIASRIAGPVRRLAHIARTLPEQDILTLDTAALAKDLPVRRKDEVGELAQAFGHMAGELQTNVTRLVASTAVQERMEKELQVARDIQYGFLPTVFPEREDVDLHASMLTAKAVGGDLYDFFFLDDSRLCFVIGDVSDKGVPAALFMSMTVTLVRVAMRDDRLSPETAMARINDALAADNPRSMFVTLCIGVLDTASGELTWSSAGHMPPVLIGTDGAHPLALSGDMMAGIFEGNPFSLMTHRMQPGEALFLYTDGVSEAMNAAKELYGDERLMAHLSRQYGVPAATVNASVFRAVQDHAHGEEQSDDIALVAIRYLGN